MELYVSEYNYPYEGSDILGIFDSLDKAVTALKVKYGSPVSLKVWKESGATLDYGYDYGSVRKYELNKSVKG